MKIKTKAYALLTLALLGGALFPIALRIAAANSVNIFTFMFYSYIIATVASFALVVATGKTRQLRGYMKNPKEYLKIGMAGFAFAGLIFYGLIYAEQFISATFATVIYRMQPLLMLMFIPFLLRERVTKTQVVALSLGFAGIYIALSGGNPFAFSGANTGIVAALLAVAIIGALASVFLKRYTTNMESTMFMFNSTSLIFATVMFLYNGAQLQALNINSIIALLYMGIPASVGVTYFYFRAFRTLKTTFVTNFYLLSPFITAMFAAVVLNEAILPYYLAIAVLVAVGIAIQRFDKRGGTYMAKGKAPFNSYLQIFDVTSAFLNTKVEAIDKTMKGNGRVLAVKLNRELYSKIRGAIDDDGSEFKDAVFVYTNSDRHLVSEEENGFISDIMGANQNETILMSAGDPEASEEFFDLVGSKMETN